MATVYLAEDIKHGRQIAIKVLNPGIGGKSGGRTVRPGNPDGGPTAASPHRQSVRLRLHQRLSYYVMPFVPGNRCAIDSIGTTSSRSMTRFR